MKTRDIAAQKAGFGNAETYSLLTARRLQRGQFETDPSVPLEFGLVAFGSALRRYPHNVKPTVTDIQTEIHGSADQRYGRRLHAVLLIENGLSYPAVARALGEAPRTLARWVRRYRDHGLAGLRERAAGRPRLLTPEQIAEVRGAVAGAPPWTAAALAAWIEHRFGVRLCDRQAGRLLSQARRILGGVRSGD